ncbi:MAG: DUF7010 family protein [Parasphingopyxis sp.]|uniref:DUF7010 family protein n=1 Tax=Parasphingopyxis sp. TaxID=1920299 RepID=UPI003FA00E1A
MDRSATLDALQTDFRATGTKSMPIAGMVCWAALGVAALYLPDRTVGTLALYIMMGILPLAFLLDRLKGANLFSGGDNPLTKMFLLSIVGIAVTVPAILIGAQAAGEPDIIVLGMAILAGVIWIPYGWAADDRVGLIHAVGRAIGCYAAYAMVEEPYRATAICAVVVVSYIYSLSFMKTVGAPA